MCSPSKYSGNVVLECSAMPSLGILPPTKWKEPQIFHGIFLYSSWTCPVNFEGLQENCTVCSIVNGVFSIDKESLSLPISI